MTNIGQGLQKGGRWWAMALLLGVVGLGLRVNTVDAALEPLPVSLSQRLTVEATEARAQLPDGSWLTLDQAGQTLRLTDAAGGDRAIREWSLPTPRRLASVTLLPSGRVLIWGGVDQQGRLQVSGLWFDPRTRTMASAGKLGLVPRAAHTATVLTNGQLLMAGGWSSGIGGTPNAELWDERSGVVTVPTSKLLPPRLGHRSVLQADGLVRLTGGIDAKSRRFERDVVFDPNVHRFMPALTKPLTANAAPRLAGSLPLAKAKEVAPDARLALRFNVPVSMAELNDSSVVLFGPGGRTQVQVVPAEEGRLVFVTPRQDLFPDSSYTLLVEGVGATNGQPLPITAIDFRTAALTSDAPAGAAGSDAKRVMTGMAGYTPTACPQKGEWYVLCRKRSELKEGVWYPGADNTDSRWRVYGESQRPTPNPGMAKVAAKYRVTALRGRVVRVDQQPVANVEVSIGTRTARTNEAGWFVLLDAPAGKQELYVDGSTANRNAMEYGQFVVAVQIAAGKLTELPYLMHLPRITARDKIKIASPLVQDVRVGHPDMPGLELRIPAGTVIRDRKGRLVTELAIVPTPVNRAPFPVMENHPMAFTVEPGGAQVQGLTSAASGGIRVYYPNYDQHRPGTEANFWIYDPRDGWKVYGKGTVSADGRQIVPEQGVALHQTMGGMFSVPSNDPAPNEDLPPDGNCCGTPGDGGAANAADPIDLRTGDFVHSETDVTIPDIIPIRVERSYRPRDMLKREFGLGTASNFNYYLQTSDNYASLSLVLPNGAFIRFNRYSGDGSTGEWRQNGSTTAYSGAVLQALFDPDQPPYGRAYRLTLRNGTQMQFGSYNNTKLLWIQDRDGNRTSLVYEAGLLSQVVTHSGRFVSFEYDTSNRVKTMRDHTGRTWSYAYNTNSLLTSVTYPDATSKSYTYKFSTMTDAACPPGGSGSQCRYMVRHSELGNPLWQHAMESITDRRGNRLLLNEFEPMQYGWIGKVVKQTLADGSAVSINYAHDDGTNIGILVTEADGSKRRIVFGTGYYPRSDTIGYGTELAQTFRFERKPSGQITARIDPLGRRTEYQYNSAGQATHVTYLAGTSNAKSIQITYTADGDLASVTDPLGRTTTLSYTARCLTKITDPLNRVTEIACNGAGQPLSMTDPLGNTTRYHYDGLELAAVVDPLGRATGMAYDALGRLIVMRDPQGRITRREYDTNGRVKKIIDSSGNVTELAYDGNGNPTAVLLPHGNGVTYTYDSRDRLTERRDALNQAEAWVYDAMGRAKTYTDRKQQTTQYAYDVLGRPTTVIYADNSIQTASYDAVNRLLQLEDSVAGTLNWQYDMFSRLLSASSPAGTISYEYDTAGRRTGMTAGSQPKVEYQYDAADQLTRILQGAEVVEFDYDALGRRTQLTLPNGVQTTYAYDAASQLTGMAYVKADQTVLGTLGYAYNSAGQRIAQAGTLASNLLPAASTGNAFDDNNRQTQYQGNALTYDANGNLTGDDARTYVWNARDQLIEIKQSGQTIAQFEYDALGRRKAKTEGGQSIQYLFDGLDPVQETQGGTVRGILTGLGIDERFARTDINGRSYFLTDVAGSTRALTDADGTLIQRYDYTPYGQTQASSGNFNNPYQYTGRELDDSGLYYYRARYYHAGMGRFISEDPIGLAGGLNSYRYAEANPISYRDPTGLVVDTVVDIGFIFYDLYRIGKDNVFGDCGNLGGNLSSLGLDIVGAAVPFATGLGAANRAIRNGHLAGGVHPKTGIPFDNFGFPDFSGVASHTVNINQTGSRAADAAAANRAAGLNSTPPGNTWHHHQDGTTMQLVPTNIHAATGHTGGVATGRR